MSINKHVNYSHILQWNIYQYFRHHICVLDDGVPSNDPAHYGASGGCQGDSGGPMIAEQNTRCVSSVYWFTVLRRCIMHNMLLQATIIRNYFVKTQTSVAFFGPPDLCIIFSNGMYLEVSPL